MAKVSQRGGKAASTSKNRVSPDWSFSGDDNTSAKRDEAFMRAMFALPAGKVGTCGGVAALAG